MAPSVELIASNRPTWGMRSRSACFTSAVHMAPEEIDAIFSDVVSYGVPALAGLVDGPDDRLGERVADDGEDVDAPVLHGCAATRPRRTSGW
jgi:hypothetical protein